MAKLVVINGDYMLQDNKPPSEAYMLLPLLITVKYLPLEEFLMSRVVVVVRYVTPQMV